MATGNLETAVVENFWFFIFRQYLSTIVLVYVTIQIRTSYITAKHVFGSILRHYFTRRQSSIRCKNKPLSNIANLMAFLAKSWNFFNSLWWLFFVLSQIDKSSWASDKSSRQKQSLPWESRAAKRRTSLLTIQARRVRCKCKGLL